MIYLFLAFSVVKSLPLVTIAIHLACLLAIEHYESQAQFVLYLRILRFLSRRFSIVRKTMRKPRSLNSALPLERLRFLFQPAKSYLGLNCNHFFGRKLRRCVDYRLLPRSHFVVYQRSAILPNVESGMCTSNPHVTYHISVSVFGANACFFSGHLSRAVSSQHTSELQS